MVFRGIKFFETDAEETSRLAQAPVGSIDHGLSLLPVTNAHPDEYHLVELPWTQLHPCSGNTGGRKHECDGSHRVVVLPVKYSRGNSGNSLPRLHDDHWGCRIVASDHPSYPVGGYDIHVSKSELRRGRVLEV